ncbi:MAG: UDP-N-acetylenolpyruvoylglucosamine reductase [Elusimicrobia bacterium RIFCSPLOWO2_12_FULL_59_9]|nr:MAG: UDP-N-acetylenolpyruvoylglucosamine reductase [Elusimicrobia bacterium RIFCSPLOWO2_12_FULL_59_9]
MGTSPKALLKRSAQTSWKKDIARAFPSAKWDEPLKYHTTFRIGGLADCYLEVRNQKELIRLYRLARTHDLPVFILGFGSNLLVRDGGLRGLTVRFRGSYERIRMAGKALVRAGAGVRLPKLAMYCAAKSLSGAEPLIGVPGTVGGGLVTNAGTRDGEIGSLVREVEVFSIPKLRCEKRSASELEFSYRSSNLKRRVILGALLKLKPGRRAAIMRKITAYQRARLETQPVHTFNVGSIFKNPPGRFVARLIESAGLKGLRCGHVQVSCRHSNFIENDGHGTSRDVLDLVKRIRRSVLRRNGIRLELEMEIVGEK